jgi:nucleolar pre-ribosomal-associated protein 1
MKDLFENLHPSDLVMWEGGDLKTASRQLLQVYFACLLLIFALM